MGLFFSTPQTRAATLEPRIQSAITEAIESPPGTPEQNRALAQQKTAEVLTQAPATPSPNIPMILGALALLVLLAIGAYVAGVYNQSSAADNLWKAFQTLFGIIAGWFGGEAIGIASKQ